MTTRDDDRAAALRDAIRLKKAAATRQTSELPPRPASSPRLLGDMQRSLWLIHRLDPTSPAYNLTAAYRIEGPLDVAAVERAFNLVVARHRLLRSTFELDGESVLQAVHPHEPREIEVLEVDHGGVREAVVEAARRPFDLERGPLVRMHLVGEESGGERVLVLVLHHILADERSLAILWGELAAAMEGRLTADEDAVQFDDYAEWLRNRAPDETDAALEFWKRRLDPLPDVVRLPFERPAAGSPQPSGRLLVRSVVDEIERGLRSLAAATGTTPFAVAALAFNLLMHRTSGGRQVAFATPVSTRSHPAAASMVGYFTNPVVVTTEIDEQHSVADSVTRFHGELRSLLDHASVPFPVLAEELAPPRQHDRHPIFQTMFVYQERSPAPNLGAARLEPMVLDLGASKFDLTLFVTVGSGPFEIAVEYRADRFDAIWMEQLLDHFQTLLSELCADPDRSLADVSMLDREESERIHAFAQGPDLETSDMPPLPQRILEQAHRAVDAEAVVCRGERLTYGQLESTARAVAAQLQAAGVSPGDRVGVFVERSVVMPAAILGCHVAGAAYVPLDPAYPEARTRGVLEDAEVTAVVTMSALTNRLPAGQWPVLDIERLESAPRDGERPPDDPQLPAYLLYTSGSTGQPKGVVVTHENLRVSTASRLAFYDEPPGRFLLLPSIAFDSSVAGLFWTLATGGTLVIPSDEQALDPRRLVELAAEERVTSLLCVPSLYAQMLALGGGELQRLECAIVAGEPCPSAVVETHRRVLGGARLFNEYGPTEATVWATVHEATEADSRQPVAIGGPIPGVRVEVVDHLGRQVPAGVPGEGWITGPTVAAGYWRRDSGSAEPFETAEQAESNGLRYRTGDLMSWTADGRLLFLGRQDEQIKLRGFRIEPGEIEAALADDPAIGHAAVVLRSTSADASSQRLVAFVETAATASADGWRDRLAQRLPQHMIPSRLVVLEALPRLPNGKIDRRRLQEIELEPEAPADRDTALATNTEQSLLSLWEGLLGQTGIGLDDNFFELGGHSLLVIEMAVAIEGDFQVRLSAAEIFENPTVRLLARTVERREQPGSAPYRHLYPIQPTGHRTPLIFAIPHFFTDSFAERFRGERPVYGLRGVGLRAEGNLGRWRTMHDLGAELVDEVGRRFGDGGVAMAGYSFGATMAFEAARQMEVRGVPAAALYLIAPMALDFVHLGPLRFQLDELRQPVDELSSGEALRRYLRRNHPFSLRLYRKIWRWWAIEPWRRGLCHVGRARRAAGLELTPSILWADVRVDRFRLHAAYRPGPIRTPSVIFNPTEPATDAAATWRPFFDGPLTVVDIPDPHFGEAQTAAALEIILGHVGDLGSETEGTA